MTTVYLFRLQGRGLQERYPHAMIYDASNNLIGEASSYTYRGTAWAVCTPDFAGPMAFDSPVIRYLSHDPKAPKGAGDNDDHRFCYACELTGCSEDSVHCGDDDDVFCGCDGKGWEVFNEDPEAGILGQVQRCDCEILPDEEAAYDSATAAGLLVDTEGNVLAEPWGVYAAEARRQAQVAGLRRRLMRAGRLLGSCPPRIQFFALKNRVFCDKSTLQLDYAGELQDFEQWIAQGKIPGFRKA